MAERRIANAAETPNASVARVTALLDTFVEARSDLGVTEIATRLGLAKSVVHRLVTALTKAGYLSQTQNTHRYSLGPRATRLGQVALGQMDIRARARPILRELAAATGETATLSTLAGDERVYAEQIESTQAVRQSVHIGQAAPLYLGASSKAILAFMPERRIEAILARAAKGTVTLTDGTRLDVKALRSDLAAIRKRGFATSQAERIVGAVSSAAPVFDHHGDVVGSVSVASVSVRHGRTDLMKFGDMVRDAADRLSTELGWPGRRGRD
jgi:DNA-binding IclR family transcriptional regulator